MSDRAWIKDEANKIVHSQVPCCHNICLGGLVMNEAITFVIGALEEVSACLSRNERKVLMTQKIRDCIIRENKSGSYRYSICT